MIQAERRWLKSREVTGVHDPGQFQDSENVIARFRDPTGANLRTLVCAGSSIPFGIATGFGVYSTKLSDVGTKFKFLWG